MFKYLTIFILSFSILSCSEPLTNPVVLIETTLGNITVELYEAKAPITVENFLSYAKNGHYAGTIFHRVIKNFMIQGGGFTEDMIPKPTLPPIKNEASNGLKNTRGTIAMARTGIIDSATSQFFINVVDNDFLDHKDNTAQHFGYCVFGEVISGMEVVDKIQKTPTGNKNKFGDVPISNIKIINVKKI